MESTQKSSEGRHARTPIAMTQRGWRDILLRVYKNLGKDSLGLISAGVAFYFLLAIFPAASAFVAIYGLLNDPVDAQLQFQRVGELLPPEGKQVLLQQMKEVTGSAKSTLGLGAFASLVFALWSAMRGSTAMITALNVVYNEEDSRGFLQLRLLAFILTVGTVLFFALSLFLIAILPPVLAVVGLGSFVEWVLSLARWPLLVLAIMFILSVFYRYGPNRTQAQWRWVTPGALLAMVLWISGSALFSWYVSRFSNYNETYGALGAVVILLMWFFLTAFSFLLGAEFNAELEHQTEHDTTVAPEQSMGERGAYMADTVGKSP